MDTTTEVVAVFVSLVTMFFVAYALGSKKRPPSRYIEPLKVRPESTSLAAEKPDLSSAKIKQLEKQLSEARDEALKLKADLKSLESEKKKLQKQFEECAEASQELTVQLGLGQKRDVLVAPEIESPNGEVSESLRIVTRTTSNPSIRTVDTWTGERNWTQAELRRLLELYNAGGGVQSMAITLNVDSRDVVYRIARSVFNCTGDLEDLGLAPNDGKRWAKVDRDTLTKRVSEQVPIREIAFSLGRTQLAIVWQVIDLRIR